MTINSPIKQAILVAGGAGYVGAHVCKALAAAGFIPVVLDNLVTGRADFVKWGPLVQACVSNEEVVAQTVRDHDIKAVIDFAGSIEVAESVINPLKYYQNNIGLKVGFLRALTNAGVQAVVFSSSAAVYGEPVSVPVVETHPLQPKNPYGWTKLLYEQMLCEVSVAGGPSWTALRYFNAAGASFDGDIGECHEPESHLIPRACFACLGRIPALDIYGTDYPTPDGTAIRDYIHVMDLASAHVQAVTQLLGGAASAAYNLGSGTGTSIGEILASFEQLGWKVPHQFKSRRAGDPARLVASNAVARDALGWKLQYSDISTIIRTAYHWHQPTTR